MVDLRQRAEEIVDQVRRGQSLVLTYRGKAVVRLEPIRVDKAPADDLFYRITELAEEHGNSLTNEEIDAIVYKP
jgi:prevent-host-death family protein